MIPAMFPNIRRNIGVAAVSAAALACFPATARADAGIPMLPMSYATMFFFLLLVIIIETIYLISRLHTSIPRTLIAVTAVNAGTMGLGFPLSWLIYSCLNEWGSFPGGVAGALSEMRYVPLWMCQRIFPDWAGTPTQIWVILAIFLTLLVPSYLVTRILKTWAFQWYDLLRHEGDIKGAVLTANRLSYLLLALTGCLLLNRAFPSR